MADVGITVTNGTEFSSEDNNAVLLIAVTNTNAIACEDTTNAYYYVSLGDGTNTEKYIFVIADAGTIAALHVENFVVENTTLGTITASSGAIYYTPAA
jgi:hypothetical protein